MTVVPTRFGLKFLPVPTLALEYEERVDIVESSVYECDEQKNIENDSTDKKKLKLHIVEFPQLKTDSEIIILVKQLQRENAKFLAPTVVKEEQLLRLVQRLVNHLQTHKNIENLDTSRVDELQGSTRNVTNVDQEYKAPKVEETHSNNESEKRIDTSSAQEDVANVENVCNKDESNADNTQMTEKVRLDDTLQSANSPNEGNTMNESNTAQDGGHSDEQAHDSTSKKTESDVSDEEILSEELEYFSEDDSDDDGF